MKFFALPFFRKKEVSSEIKALAESAIVFCKDLKELIKTDPKQAQDLLQGAWHSHLSDYGHLALLSQQKKLRTGVEPSALMAMIFLTAYFNECGDWDKMIEFIKTRYK